MAGVLARLELAGIACCPAVLAAHRPAVVARMAAIQGGGHVRMGRMWRDICACVCVNVCVYVHACVCVNVCVVFLCLRTWVRGGVFALFVGVGLAAVCVR
jgi:hypothetical protein